MPLPRADTTIRATQFFATGFSEREVGGEITGTFGNQQNIIDPITESLASAFLAADTAIPDAHLFVIDTSGTTVRVPMTGNVTLKLADSASGFVFAARTFAWIRSRTELILADPAAVNLWADTNGTGADTFPEALNALLPFKLERADLEITLVPEGCLYTMSDRRMVRDKHIKAGFAFRAGEDLTMARRYALRTAAHELFHTLLRMNGIPFGEASSPRHAKEEEAAVAIETCAELHITGSTSQGLWKDWDLSENDVAQSEAGVSLTAPARMQQIWGDLFSEEPPASATDDTRADRLDAICRKLIAEVVSENPSD